MSNELKRIGQRAVAGFAALALGTGLTLTSLLTPAAAHAYPTGGQVQSRALYMSNSTPSSGSAQNYSYLVTFKPANVTSIKGVIVDFCSTSPIIGDTCTAPTAFSIGAPTVSTAAVTAGTNAPVSTNALPGTWTSSALNSGRTLKMVNSSGTGSLNTSNLYGFVISTVTNPSTLGTFYARIITYTSDTGDIASYTDSTPGSVDALDYGGYALSTVTNVSLTAKVQESLTFCASGKDISGATVGTDKSCTQANSPTLTLGHGSPSPGILDNTAVDATYAYTQVSTNATNGLAIRMHATNSCAGLSATGGTSCAIPGVGGTSASTFTAGSANFFGLCVLASTTTTGVTTSSGTVTPDTNYNDGTHVTPGTSNPNIAFGMDDTTGSGVNSTYGDKIASATGPVSQVNNQLVFGATASLTVPAGIYTANESLIATGTF